MGAVNVSVIIPAFNSGKFIQNTLHSVLQQTYGNFEIIIVDDGSKDNTCDIVEKIKNPLPLGKIRLFSQAHQGSGAARNAGISNAAGEIISFLDSDDSWSPNKLEKITAVFRQHPDINLVAHDLMRVYPDGRRERFKLPERFNPQVNYFVNLFKLNCLVTSAASVKKSVILSAGLFDTDFPPAEEYDLWLKMAPLAKPFYINEVLGFYTVRSGSQSEAVELRLKQEIRVLRKHYPALKKKTFFAPFILRARIGQVCGAVGKDLQLLGSLGKALKLFLISFINWPFNFKLYVYPFAFIKKRPVNSMPKKT